MRSLSWLVLAVTAGFLVLGNVPRFLPLTAAFGNANVGEVILYAATMPFLGVQLLVRRLSLRPVLAYAFALITLLSLGVGLIKWGVSTEAVTYNLRFVLQLLSAVAIGQAMADIYASDVTRLVRHFGWVYVVAGFLALLLLMAFPESAVLWSTLSDAGIEFGGDPHIGRLVSFYFDPNYFGTILVLPVILMAAGYDKGYRVALGIPFLIVCLVLTASRSGISTLFLCGCYIVLLRLLQFLRGEAVPRTLLLLVPLLPAIPVAMAVMLGDYGSQLVERFTSVGSDASANQRLQSFQIGNTLIGEEPLLGFGYNYGLTAVRQHRHLALDSSLQTLILNYGVVLSLLLLVIAAMWARARYLTLNARGSRLRRLWEYVFLYLSICMLWSGNFNQLLFYPFWVVPVFALLTYVDVQMAREEKVIASSPIPDSAVLPPLPLRAGTGVGY